MLTRIISGGQTGADQGGLAAAEELGLATGGYMPKGYRTDTGPDLELAKRFGMWEHRKSGYPPRTEANVNNSDGTLIFGTRGSAGSKLTDRLCKNLNKPMFAVYWKPGVITDGRYADFRWWIDNYQIKTLNVAGNCESTNPGVFDACKAFLTESLRKS